MDPVSISAVIMPCVVAFIVEVRKHKDKKEAEMREGERVREQQNYAKLKQQRWEEKVRIHEEDERVRKEEEQKRELERKEKRERKAQKEREKKALEERERLTQHKRDEVLERERQRLEAQRKEEKNQRRAEKEVEMKAREEEQRQAQQKRDEEWERETLRLDKLQEELETETRERREGERRIDQSFECLTNQLRQGIKMFLHFWRCQQGYAYACRVNGGHQSYEELLPSSGRVEEFGNDEEELRAIFNASIQGKIGNSSVGASSYSPSSNYSKELAPVEIPEQFLASYENDILSLVTKAIYGETLSTQAGNVESKQCYDALREKGNAYFKDKNFTEAIECYTLSIDQSPTAAAYANRALAYIKLNKFAEAEKDCTKALKIDCRYFKAYARRAMARKEHGRDLYGALDDVDEALKLESDNQDMKALRSELYTRLSSA